MDTAHHVLGGDVALVTGAARSIGRALALGLARAGASVVVADLDIAGAEETAALIRAAGGTAMAQHVDVTEAASCIALALAVEQCYGPLSVLVNNAGVMFSGAIDSPGYMDNWRRTFEVNVSGAMQMVIAFLPQLRRTRARIVNICSTAAYLAAPGGAMYGSSKAALVQMTRALAVELGPHGIRVNGVAPGAVFSEGGMSDPALIARVYLPRTPTGQMTTAEDMVAPVVFLGAAASGQISGTVIPVEGGFLSMGVRFD